MDFNFWVAKFWGIWGSWRPLVYKAKSLQGGIKGGGRGGARYIFLVHLGAKRIWSKIVKPGGLTILKENLEAG